MRRRKETSNEQPKRTRALSAVMIVAIALSVFVGIVLAENSSTSTDAKTDSPRISKVKATRSY